MSFFNSLGFSITYFLFTFFAIQAALVIAWQHWQRNLSLSARRLAIAFGAILLLRLIGFGYVAAMQSGDARLTWELGLGSASMAVLAWGLSPYFKEKTLFANLFILISFGIVGVLLALPAFGAPSLAADYGLLTFTMLVGALLIVSMLTKLSDAQPFAVVATAVLLAGAGIEMAIGDGDIPVYTRISEIVAYVLFSAAVYQDFLDMLDIRSKTLLNLRETSEEQIEGLTGLFEATGSIVSSLQLPDVLDGAVKAVVRALNVDQSAIALFEDSAHTVLRMTASYNPQRRGSGDAVTFPISEQPALKHALERVRQVEINKGYQNPQVQFLFAMMGSPSDAGPLVVQPLVVAGKPIGALVVGNAQSKRPFSSTELQLIETMSTQIAVAINNARKHQELLQKSQKLVFTLRNQEKETSRQTAALESELKKAHQENNQMAQRLYEQETLARKSQKELTEYQQQVQQLSQQLKMAQVRYDEVTAKHSQLISVTQSHKKQLAKLKMAQDEIAELRAQLEEMALEAGEAKKLSEALAAAQQRSRKLARALKANKLKLQQQSVVPADAFSADSQAWENLSCGVLVSDAKGAINRVNTATSQLFSLSGSQLIGKPLDELVPDDAWRKAVRRVAAAEVPLATTALKMDDRMVKATISPITDPANGTVTGNVVILYDATDEFETQHARDEFIASLAQELRTPMTSIIGYVDLLLGESVGVIGKMQRKFLQRVKANVERMDGLLNDLIGIAAIDAGQLQLNPAPLNIAKIIESAVVNAKAQLEEKEIQLKIDLPAQMPIVEADAVSMQQVVVNLLNNATLCTPVGGDITISATVTNSNLNAVSLDEEEQWLRVAVTDSGGGIAEKDIDRVFDRFYKADNPLIQGLGETGVGLSIVKHIIEAHGGEVWFETEMGRGTTFYFAMPVIDTVNDPWEEVDVPPLDLNPEG